MQTWAWLLAGLAIIVLLLVALISRRRAAAIATVAEVPGDSLADHFIEPVAVPVAQDDAAFAAEQDELLDQLAEHPDDVRLHLELVGLYYDRRDVEHFEAAAEAMYAHIGNPHQAQWQDVVHMGQDLAPEHPLFAPRAQAEAAAEWAQASMPQAHPFGSESLHAQDVPPLSPAIPVASPLPENVRPLEPLESYADEYNVPPHAPSPVVDPHAFSWPPEPAAIPPAAQEESVAAADPIDSASQLDGDLPATRWHFEEPDDEEPTFTPVAAQPHPPHADADDLPHFDDDALDTIGMDHFSDDPVDTKLDLARAYIDMGDADGARAMLEEALLEGSQMQQDVARKLLTELP